MPRKMKPKSKSAPQAQKIVRTVKGAQRVWKENVELFLEVCGAFKPDTLDRPSVYEWRLHTSGGDLDITVHPDCIHARFDDVIAGHVATKALGFASTASGKWNFYYSEEEISSQSALIQWSRLIEDLLDYRPSEEQIKELGRLRKAWSGRRVIE